MWQILSPDKLQLHLMAVVIAFKGVESIAPSVQGSSVVFIEDASRTPQPLRIEFKAATGNESKKNQNKPQTNQSVSEQWFYLLLGRLWKPVLAPALIPARESEHHIVQRRWGRTIICREKWKWKNNKTLLLVFGFDWSWLQYKKSDGIDLYFDEVVVVLTLGLLSWLPSTEEINKWTDFFYTNH